MAKQKSFIKMQGKWETYPLARTERAVMGAYTWWCRQAADHDGS